MVNKLDLCFCVFFLLFSVFSDVGVAQRKLNRNVPVGADVKQNLNFDCPEEFGYYPHPTDCTQYYVCVFGGALLESCTGGLMYSHELQTCDWPRNVGCEGLGDVAITASSPVSQPLNKVQSERVRYTVASAPPPPPQPAAVVTSRGQPKHTHHASRQEIAIAKHQQQQQQLYAEAEETLPPAEEIETPDRQQRVYRGQPSTIGQVQRDRDGVRHSNAIPVSTTRGEKIGVISFGTQQQPVQQQYRRIEEAITPQTQQIAIVQSTPPSRTIYNGSQHYDPSQYDHYYALYDEDVELYKDVDYTPHYSNNREQQSSNQHPYRGTPATVTVQSTLVEEKPVPQRSNSYVQNTYSTQAQDIYQPAIQDYSENNYQTQVDDQSNYRQQSRQPSRSPNATANQARPQSIFITLKTPLSGPPEHKESQESDTQKPTSTPGPDPNVPSKPTPDKDPTDELTTPTNNGSIFLFLTAGFAHRQNNNRDHLMPVTYKPNYVHRPTTQENVNNRTSIRFPTFSLSNLPTADKKSVTFQLSTRLSTPLIKKSESLQQLPSSDVRSTENPNKREVAFNRNSYLNSFTNTSYQNIVPTTYAPSRVFLAMLLPKPNNTDVTDANNQDHRTVISSQEFEEKSKNLFKSYKENHEKESVKRIKPPHYDTSNEYTSTESSSSERNTRRIVSRINFGLTQITTKNPIEKKNVFLNSEEYFNTARKFQTTTTTTSEKPSIRNYENHNLYLQKSSYFSSTPPPTTERVLNQFKVPYNFVPTTTIRIPVTASLNISRTTKTFVHQIGLEDVTTEPTKFIPITTQASVSSSVKSEYFQSQDENVRRTTENARYVSTTTKGYNWVRNKFSFGSGEKNRFVPTTEQYLSSSSEQYYEPKITTVANKPPIYRLPIFSSNGFKYVNNDYYQSKTSTTTDSYSREKTETETEKSNRQTDYTYRKFSSEHNDQKNQRYSNYKLNYDSSTDGIPFENSSEDYSSTENYESSSTTESEYRPKQDSKPLYDSGNYRQSHNQYSTTTHRPRQVVITTTTQEPVTISEQVEQKPKCKSVECELLPNRNTNRFRATVEVPTVPEILASIEETPSKYESDISPTYKLKPIQKPDLTITNNITLSNDNSRITSIPARLSRVNTAIKSLIGFGGTRRTVPKCNEKQLAPNAKCNEIQNQRTSTRGRGSAHYTSAGEQTITVNVNRGTPAPRARPTLKPSTSIVSKASEFVDIYRYPPQRPESIYPQPQVDKTAAKCRKDVCLLPDCSCGGRDIPGDLPVEQVPQIVLLTFDDSVNDLNKGLYSDLFEKGRYNPNGCPISATFYVSHEWTDYSQVQNLYADGHEIASHTVSHSFGEQFSQKKWYREVAGQREILAAYGGVHLEDVRGMRAPFLSVGGNKMFKMLYDANFTYDSSMPVYENRPPSWPYTLDYKLFHDCMIPPCPTRSYPGVWEVPMVMWQDLNGGRCSMGDACSNPPDSDGVYKMLIKNFERHYTTNRAPFGLFYHAAWFTQPHHKEGFIKFLDYLTSQNDVYLVTNWQALQWIRDPTPLNRIKNFPGFQCHYPDRPKRCNNPKVCNLWHKSGVRYMRTCQPCPDIYPWTGKTGIRSSRIDNDIED